MPANLTSTAGGGTNRTIDPDLKGPFVDEYTAGLDLGLSRMLTLQFNYVRKIDGNGNKSINLALPYDAYTVTTTGIDPGHDKTFGNQSVEGTIDLFNALNTNTITNQTNRNGSTYLSPTEIIAPRVFRLGVRYRF